MYSQHDFYSNFSSISKSNDESLKKGLIVNELADIIINNRKELLTVFSKANVNVPTDPTDEQLVDAFLNNYDKNKQLVIGVSYLISHKNQKFSGVDGAPSDPVGMIAGALGSIAGATQQGLANRGAKQQAKSDLVQSIINKRNPQTAGVKKKKVDNSVWWILGGVAVVITGIVIYKKYKYK